MRKYKGVSKSYLDRTDKLLHCSLFSFFLRVFIGSFSSSLRKNLTLPQAHPVSPYNNQRKLLFSLLLPKKYLFSLNPLASLQNTPLCPPKLSLPPSISSQLFVRLNFFQENEKKKLFVPFQLVPQAIYIPITTHKNVFLVMQPHFLFSSVSLLQTVMSPLFQITHPSFPFGCESCLAASYSLFPG